MLATLLWTPFGTRYFKAKFMEEAVNKQKFLYAFGHDKNISWIIMRVGESQMDEQYLKLNFYFR
jgi:hypothetical protein